VRPRVLVVVLLAAIACTRAPAPDTQAPRALPPVAPPPPAATPSVPSSPDDLVAETPESNPHSETVTVKLVADQARKARVFWGRKDLGFAPLELQRPRGSGPLDLVVVAPGALTLHTRVFTDRDDRLALRFYAATDAPTMLGYRADDDPALKPPKNPAENAKRKAGAQVP
jgi:hypothetical protein